LTIVRGSRVFALRATYTAVFASSLVYLGAGDVRAFLLALTAALSVASMFERVLCVVEVVPTLIHLLCTFVGGVTFALYTDSNTRGFVVLCVILPLLVYAVHAHEVDRASGEEHGAKEELGETEEIYASSS
jgi:hypothetical protein